MQNNPTKKVMNVGDTVKILESRYYKCCDDEGMKEEDIQHGHVPQDGDIGEVVGHRNGDAIVRSKNHNWKEGQTETEAEAEENETLGHKPYVQFGYDVENLELVEAGKEKSKKLATKEDYLNKLLEGVAVMQEVKKMNESENEMIDKFIASLFEEMKPQEQEPDEQEKKDGEQDEASKKKSSEENGQKSGQAKSQKGQKAQSSSDEKSDGGSSEEEDEELTEAKKEAALKRIAEIKERLEELKKEADKRKAAEDLATEAVENTGVAQDRKKVEDIKLGTADNSVSTEILKEKEKENDKEGMPGFVKAYEGGENQGRNKQVKKSKTGRLYANPKR